MKRIVLTLLFLFPFALVASCGSEEPAQNNTIGSGATGGIVFGSGATGGVAMGGVATGGTFPTGGTGGCLPGQQLCSGTCTDVLTSLSNCGTCGVSCPVGLTCSNGACACPAGQLTCNGVCADPATDGANCGTCGTTCALPTPYCSNGVCALTCGVGQTACGGGCFDTSSSAAHCGACNAPCPATAPCVGGVCGCPQGLVDCGAGCTDFGIDPNNCGACGTVCQGGSTCSLGICSCPVGSLLCGGTCVIGTSCPCNPACAAGETCVAGSCQANTCSPACTGGKTCVGGTCTCPAGQTDCSGTCVDLASDAANCLGCGLACTGGKTCANGCVCPAGQEDCNGACVAAGTCATGCTPACAAGYNCVNGTCTCPAGQTDCSGTCSDLTSSSTNCGACGTACVAPRSCAASTCACPAGQTDCSGTCVDTASSPTNCGTCGNACTGGRTCAGSTCTCPAGQVYCGGACIAGTTCTTTGPTDLACPHGTVAAANVISDFDQSVTTADDDEISPYLIMYQQGARGNTPWYGYGADTASSTVLTRDTTQRGPCSTTGGAMKAVSTGNTQWGAGFGVNFAPDAVNVGAPPAVDKKGEYDTTGTGYTGVGFYMKCDPEVQFVYFKVPDGPNDGDIVTPSCSYSATPTCNQYGIKNVAVTQGWTYYPLYFSELLQDPNPTLPWGSNTGVNLSRLTAVQVQVNSKYDSAGNPSGANGFTCWIDDVHFITTPAPTVTPPTGTCGTGAPGGYTVSGNQFRTCAGTQKFFRGLSRPSFEWDMNGWNITREDLQRLKTWGTNVVRFPIRQSFWLDAQKGTTYQKNVQRAVKWTLEAGMDAIIDLHLLDSTTLQASPNAQSPTFWTQVANLYKNDGRVIFELYNEPYSDASTWRNWMDQLYTAVRGAGANNLVLMGGLDYAYDLNAISGQINSSWINVGYVTHPYSFKASSQADRQTKYLNFAQTHAVIATEFGDADINGTVENNGCGDGDCCTVGAAFIRTVVPEFTANGISWTAWAWNVDAIAGCGFPVLLNNWAATSLTAPGTATKACLANPTTCN